MEGIAAILNLAMSRGRATTNQTVFAGEVLSRKGAYVNMFIHSRTCI